MLVSSTTADAAHRIEYIGTTDEFAFADSALAGFDASIAYHHADQNLSITGYTYTGEGNFVTAKNGQTTFKTIATLQIAGDGSTKLVLYFAPKQYTITYYIGDASIPNLSATPTPVKLYADQSYTLPTTEVTRSGYTLKGWTNSQYVTSVDAATIISNLKGIKSQNAFTSISADTTRNAITGKVFTAVVSGGQTLYYMPTGDVTLYATWRANDNTEYLVERWVVSGDGTRYAVTSDGKLVRDANGRLVTSATADAGHVVKHVGITRRGGLGRCRRGRRLLPQR